MLTKKGRGGRERVELEVELVQGSECSGTRKRKGKGTNTRAAGQGK
jgi:hypothetical protein